MEQVIGRSGHGRLRRTVLRLDRGICRSVERARVRVEQRRAIRRLVADRAVGRETGARI